MDDAPPENGRAPVWTRDAARPPAAAAGPHARPVRGRRRRGADADRGPLGRRWRRPSRPRSTARSEPLARGTPRERTLRGAAGGARAAGERIERGDQGVLRLRAGAADHRVAEPATQSKREVLTKPRAALGARARRRRAGARPTTRRGWTARSPPRGSRAAPRSRSSRRRAGWGRPRLTVLLGSLLARVRRDRIVAVDTNPDFGSLGPHADPRPPGVRRRPGRRPRAARPVGDGAGSPSRPRVRGPDGAAGADRPDAHGAAQRGVLPRA